MTDRELLELAALAGGIEYDASASKQIDGRAWFGLWLTYDREPHEFDRRYWNPRAHDGDVFRLAVALQLEIEHNNPLDNSLYVLVARCGIEMVRDPVQIIEEIECESQRQDATRRAIVRAAAEIGKAIREKGL